MIRFPLLILSSSKSIRFNKPVLVASHCSKRNLKLPTLTGFGSHSLKARFLHVSSRPLAKATKDEAMGAFKVWTAKGLGSRGSVNEYSKSGEKYDHYMESLSYCGPQKVAEAAASILGNKFHSRILDVCAGSGLGGQELSKLGYVNVDAVDAAEGLLELAKARSVYKDIVCHLLGGQNLPIEDNHYDMAVISGGIGENHFPLSAFIDLIRVVRPGGHVINVFREGAGYVSWYGDGLEPFLADLAKEGLWHLVSRETFPGFLDGMDGLTLIHRVH